MADFFDVVIKDVELYGAGADTSEPVSAVNANMQTDVLQLQMQTMTVWLIL